LKAAATPWPIGAYNRDGKRSKRQIVIGLLCVTAGRPLHRGIIADATLAVAII